MRVGIALGDFASDGNQAAIFQFTDCGCGRFRQFDQFGQQDFPAFFNDVPDVLLALGQFRKIARDRQCADQQPFPPAGVFLPHGFRQNGFQRGFRSTTVIIRDPAGEFQDFGRHQRLRPDDFDDGLEPGLGGFLGDRGDDAQDFARTKRHLYSAAHVNLSGQVFRDGVVKLLAQGDLETDAGNHVQSCVMDRISASTFPRSCSRASSVNSRGTWNTRPISTLQRANGRGIWNRSQLFKVIFRER